jgi:formate C-acetyltransferase
MGLEMAKRGYVAGSVIGTGSTDRVKKLNAETRTVPGTICLHRARAYTEVYKGTESLPPILRRAIATVKSLDTMPPFIVESELIVGDRACGLKKYPLHPELETDWIMMEGGLSELVNCGCTPEQEQEFNEEFYPYWQGKTLLSKYVSSAPEFLIDKTLGSGFVESGFALGLLGTHGNPDWEYIMGNGLNSYKKRAQEKLEAWDYMKSTFAQM